MPEERQTQTSDDVDDDEGRKANLRKMMINWQRKEYTLTKEAGRARWNDVRVPAGSPPPRSRGTNSLALPGVAGSTESAARSWRSRSSISCARSLEELCWIWSSCSAAEWVSCLTQLGSVLVCSSVQSVIFKVSSGFSTLFGAHRSSAFFFVDANLSDLNSAAVFAGAVYLNFFVFPF